jgi:hypothetical protein
MAVFGFDFFVPPFVPNPDPKAKREDPPEPSASEEMDAVNAKGGCKIKWDVVIQQKVDEKFVRHMVTKACRTGLKMSFTNVALGDDEDESTPVECMIPLDCAPLLLGEKSVTSSWPQIYSTGNAELLKGKVEMQEWVSRVSASHAFRAGSPPHTTLDACASCLDSFARDI